MTLAVSQRLIGIFAIARSAIVTFKQVSVGSLTEDGRGTVFLYHPDCRVAIACALPIEARQHRWREGLHPFFQHLGPEGWLRGRQARAGGSNDQDDFGILLRYGADCIGAVGIVPVDGTAPVFLSTGDPLEEAAARPGRTLSGVQQKLLAFRDETGFHACVRLEDPATHIAKFNRDDLPTLVQNEDLSLRLAREILGADVVAASQIATLSGIETVALLVERFDRVGTARLRLEDFAQILAKSRGQDFQGKYQSSYEEAATAIARHSVRARVDLERYFRLVVFNLAIGNADAHLKNFSLLETDDGLRFSPAYDLVNTLVYPQYDRIVALELGGQKQAFDTLDRTTIAGFGRAIGLPQAAVDRAIDLLAKRFRASKVLASLSHAAPDDFRVRYQEFVADQAARLFA
jgi:serine/threonine-protein kinase HipA